MQRGSLFAGVISLLGACAAFGGVVVLREPISMYSALGCVLLLNAGVRFRMAATRDADEPER